MLEVLALLEQAARPAATQQLEAVLLLVARLQSTTTEVVAMPAHRPLL